jgi:hypothetical protein
MTKYCFDCATHSASKDKKILDSSEAKGVFLAWCETVINGLTKELHLLFNFILSPVDKS